MGKAKPVKKSGSPLKISTSLFQRKTKNFASSSSESEDDSNSTPIPSPSTKKSMKAKSSKPEQKSKTVPKKTSKGSQNSSPGTSAAALKQSKSGSKAKSIPEKKLPIKGKGSSEREKAAVKAKPVKGNKGSPVKSTAKTPKNTKGQQKPTKTTKVPTLRKRSKSNSTVTSSASSTTNSTASSSSRTPSPVQSTHKSPLKSKTSPSKPDPRKVPKKEKSGTKSSTIVQKQKEKDKAEKGKGGSKPGKPKPVKVTGPKAKGSVKAVKPKAKLKRMASLNAKAILEASFQFEPLEKKQKSPAVTPTKTTLPRIPQNTSTSTSTDNDDENTGDFKPLTLLFSSSQPEVPIPKAKSLSPGGERKRKSSVVKVQPTITEVVVDRRDSITASIENSIAKAISFESPPIRRTSTNLSTGIGTSSSSTGQNKHNIPGIPVKIKKNEKRKSKSPTPRKKSKVASSSVSTSTSPFEHHEEEVAFLSRSSQPMIAKHGLESSSSETSGIHAEKHAPFSAQGQTNTHHQIQQTSLQHSTTTSGKHQKSASCQTKEKVNKSSAPVAHFDTVYQIAGPLIEPHKTLMTGSVPAGLLPDSVRIPSDLKVTYQTNPPSTSVLTHSTSTFSSQSSKGSSSSSSSKHASEGKGHATGSTNTASQKSNKQILHQPYKSSLTTSVSAVAARPTPQPQQVEQSASFGHPGSFSMPGSLSSSLPAAAAGYLSQQSQMGGGITIGPSNIPPGVMVPAGGSSESIIPAYPPTATSSTTGVYYGFGSGAAHSSPFTPSKYPFVAPDYRPPQHSSYPSSFMYPGVAPQPSPSYFMTPFYTPPSAGAASLGFGTNQARPLLSAHLPSAAATAAYYQSGPPLAHHPASNYYVASPSVQPSHHSIQPATAPGHAGHSPLNRSSQTACPSTSCPPNSSSISNNSSTTFNNKTNNIRVNKQLQPKRQLPSASSGSPRQALDLAIKKSKTPTKSTGTKTTANRKKESATLLDLSKTSYSKSIDIVQSQAKQLESAKTFTEQYSLPDDITITPIIMSPGNTSASAYYGNGLKSPTSYAADKKKRDIVHVIDPRSGLSTTIAKHISNNNLLLGSSPSNVSPVKPNNAGNVGKISPDLDVIVISRGSTGPMNPSALKKTPNRRQSGAQFKLKQQTPVLPTSTQSFNYTKSTHHRMALVNSGAANNNFGGINLGPLPPIYQMSGQLPITNLVQPLPQQVLAVARSENTSKTAQLTGVKRKGLSLNECIDGLKMKKKMRILGDTNISVKMGATGTELETSLPTLNSPILLPSTVSTNPTSILRTDISGQQQKAGRKDNKPRQRPRKVSNASPGVRRVSATINRRTTSTESDIGSTIINGPEAVAAASALVVLPHKANGSTVKLPMQFSYSSGRRTPTPSLGKKARVEDEIFDGRKRKPIKMKICTVGGKVITRSATQNSKVKTRAKTSAVTAVGQSALTPEMISKKGARNRQVLLRTRKDGNRSDSSVRSGNDKAAKTKPRTIFPSYFNTAAAVAAAAGNGSSTLTTSNNHVILRIPKGSSQVAEKSGRTGYREMMGMESGRYGQLSSGHYQTGPTVMSTSGNMTLNALKKRAIVKPLSPAVVNNGAIHSMPMANRKALPTYPHPRWSNGWTFEGDSFEAKVYLRNDDNAVLRRCYSSMRHDGGDIIRPRDCVLLKSGVRKTDLPFVAKVAALWESPNDGEMMFSLLWYYRPEHTDIGRSKEDMVDEIFASRHRDCNSVATIEDRCYVLTYNEYCRYKKRIKQLQEGIPGSIYPPLVPLSTDNTVSSMAVTNFAVEIAAAVWYGMSTAKAGEPTTSEQSQTQSQPPSTGKVSPEVVFFCRKVYDYRQKRMLKNPS